MAFNYLGPNTGPSTVSGTLPSGVPGTVPAAIPGMSSPANVGSVAPTGSIIPSRPIIPQGPVPPALAAAIGQGGPSGPPPPPMPPEPHEQQYGTTTQADGSILIYLKNANGSKGPVVTIIPFSKLNKVGRPPEAGPK